jgi:hypothetical protein
MKKQLIYVFALMVACGCSSKKEKAVDGGSGIGIDTETIQALEDGHNKEAILDGPDGTSTQAFTGSKDKVEVDLLDIDEMPKTAVRQPDAYFQHAVYINVDRPSANEGEIETICSVWLADEKAGMVLKVCVTNPMAELQWERMQGRDADAVDVPITQIAAADKAYVAPGDVSKVIVEGCPDSRNIWTYIIDPYSQTALQLPSTEGVVSLDWEHKEIIAASYGYDDDGRYSVKKAYSLEGKFLRRVGDKERE